MHYTVAGRTTVPINEIITGGLPRPANTFNPHMRYLVVLQGGYYRLADGRRDAMRFFAAARASGMSTVPVEIIESRAYRAGIFTEPVTCACRPAMLRPRITPGGGPTLFSCECAS